MIGEYLSSKKLIKVGQRWLRFDPDYKTKIIIEVTETNGKSITGPAVQFISDSKPDQPNRNQWCSDIEKSYCVYTYLPGQDAIK